MQDRQDHAVSVPLRVLRVLGLILVGLIITVCVLLFATERWLFHTWSLIDMDEIFYHLSTSIEGTNPEMVSAYIWHYGVWVLAAAAAFAALMVLLRKHRTARTLAVFICLAVSLGFAEFALFDVESRIGLVEYIRDLNTEKVSSGDFYIDNYVDPAAAKLTFPEKKRNLIYIFLESVETTYADEKNGGAFEKNAIPELTKLAQENEDFSGDSALLNGGVPLSGTTWTMGAMFGQTSGLPLKMPISKDGKEYNVTENFFPGLTTLGDILEDAGYHQVMMFGSDAGFASRDHYFQMHGNYEMLDYNYAMEQGWIPKDYYVFWGYEDEKLFDYAKQELETLAAEDEPFNFSMLTVDTHFEDGYVCPLCGDEFGDNQYANVMACSSRQVAAFVAWIQQQDFYENTTIVITGDHLTMDTDFCADVSKDYQRRTFTAIINSAVEPTNPERTRSFSTLDLFPTTLASLGVSIKGSRLGLGTNLYSLKDTLLEQYGEDGLNKQLHASSTFMNRFMDTDLSEETIEQAADEATLTYRVESNGKLTFVLDSANQLSPDSIDKAELRFTDADDETKTYTMKVTRLESDSDVFNCLVKTDLTEADIKGGKMEAYLTVAGFAPYLMATETY